MVIVHPGTWNIGGKKTTISKETAQRAAEGTSASGQKKVIVYTQPKVYPGQVARHSRTVTRTAGQVVKAARTKYGEEANISKLGIQAAAAEQAQRRKDTGEAIAKQRAATQRPQQITQTRQVIIERAQIRTTPYERRILALQQREQQLEKTSQWAYEKLRIKEKERTDYNPDITGSIRYHTIETGKAVLRLPFEVGKLPSVIGGRIGLFAESMFKPEGRQELKAATKEVPKEVIKTYNIKTPTGRANIIGTAVMIKAMQAKTGTRTVTQRATINRQVQLGEGTTKVISAEVTDTGVNFNRIYIERQTATESPAIIRGTVEAGKFEGSITGTPENIAGNLKKGSIEYSIIQKETGTTIKQIRTTPQAQLGSSKVSNYQIKVKTVAQYPKQSSIKLTRPRTTIKEKIIIDEPGRSVRTREIITEQTGKQIKFEGLREVTQKVNTRQKTIQVMEETATPQIIRTKYTPGKDIRNINLARIRQSKTGEMPPNIYTRAASKAIIKEQAIAQPKPTRIIKTKTQTRVITQYTSRFRPIKAITEKTGFNKMMASKKTQLQFTKPKAQEVILELPRPLKPTRIKPDITFMDNKTIASISSPGGFIPIISPKLKLSSSQKPGNRGIEKQLQAQKVTSFEIVTPIITPKITQTPIQVPRYTPDLRTPQITTGVTIKQPPGSTPNIDIPPPPEPPKQPPGAFMFNLGKLKIGARPGAKGSGVFNPRYVSSLEAAAFNIKGMKPGRIAAGSGLTLRPLLR